MKSALDITTAFVALLMIQAMARCQGVSHKELSEAYKDMEAIQNKVTSLNEKMKAFEAGLEKNNQRSKAIEDRFAPELDALRKEVRELRELLLKVNRPDATTAGDRQPVITTAELQNNLDALAAGQSQFNSELKRLRSEIESSKQSGADSKHHSLHTSYRMSPDEANVPRNYMSVYARRN